MLQNKKITFTVIIGNILDYYDFLLFAHIGSIITPYFFPDVSLKEAHILSLFLFGGSFVIRPIGAIIFGYISDVSSRKLALLNAVKWAIFPALGIACLPGCEQIGFFASCLFVILRLFQGFSLGGEYTNAGTYLMEYNKDHLGLISGILVASGTVGSLIGYAVSVICIFYHNEYPWLWRVAFLIGAIAACWSYGMRHILVEIKQPKAHLHSSHTQTEELLWLRRLLVIFFGILVGITNWLPTTYTNFYVTKIRGEPVSKGLMCTLIALLCYIILSPFFGFIADKAKRYRNFMMSAALCALPLSITGFMLLEKGHCYLAQVLLITAAASFGAAIHPAMNALFPAPVRARNVSLLFTIGLSFGGMAPSIISYYVDKTGYHLIPAFVVAILAGIMASLLYIYETKQQYNIKFSKNMLKKLA